MATAESLHIFLFWHSLTAWSRLPVISLQYLFTLFLNFSGGLPLIFNPSTSLILNYSYHMYKPPQYTVLYPFNYSTIYSLCCWTHVNSNSYSHCSLHPYQFPCSSYVTHLHCTYSQLPYCIPCSHHWYILYVMIGSMILFLIHLLVSIFIFVLFIILFNVPMIYLPLTFFS